MTKDRMPQRTVDVDAEEWTPFGGPVPGTAAVDETVDAHPSTVHADAAGWNPRIIEGGRGRADAPGQDDTADEDTAESMDGSGVDVLDAVTADVLGILDASSADAPPAPAAVDPGPAAEPTPEPVEELPAPVVEVPAAGPEAPVQAPAAPAQEATPHPTLHTPSQATPEAPAPVQSPAGPAETPHSTPWWKTAVGWLNPYEVLDQPLPPVSAIYEGAWDSVTDRSGFDRATEIAWVYVIGMPVTVACYTLAAAVQRKMRGLGVAATVVLWITAANTATVDASVLWTWTAVGYWVSTAFVLPAVIQAKK
ncbi:hypothetical protein [Glycomyces sp. NPDC021274]|uniref:hypothetical protein n=1 Tax=Glycomyces sp. NPDC021274 TaxID=3155120 RepID=UPI0033E945BF